MKILEMLNEQTMILDLATTDKNTTLQTLAQTLYDAGKISDLEAYLTAIHEREAHGSTGVGFGIAIPHAKTASVLTPALVYGYHPEGVEFASLDGEKAHYFFMIAAPEGANNLHLQTLAKLSRKLIDESFREALSQAQSKEDVLAHLGTIDKEEDQ